MKGIVLDAGGMIALERDDRRVVGIIRTIVKEGDRILVPATALAQVLRNPARQVRLWRMVNFSITEIVPLDKVHAQAVGALLAISRTADIADAHLAVCAQESGYAVITSDPADLKRLDPTLELIPV